MVKESNRYVAVKIPKNLIDEIDKLVGTFGYTSRAEVCKDGVRMVLRQKLNEDPQEAR